MRYEDKTFDLNGRTFTVKNGRTIWDFKHIQEWADKKRELEELESKYKESYSAFKRGDNIVNEDGEVLERPKVSFAKNSITVK